MDKLGPFELGRVHCADCVEAVGHLPNGCVGSVVTDPPYGMSFRSNHRAEKNKRIAGDNDAALMAWAVTLQALHSRYVFCRWDNLVRVPAPRSFITWVKNNWSMGDLEHEHARQTEGILFYPGEQHAWTESRPTDVVSAPRSGNVYHPSEKPIELMEAVVRWTSGIVLDPFSGSGSTGVACARLGRQFLGFEIDPEYCRIANERIQAAEKGISVEEVKVGQQTLF